MTLKISGKPGCLRNNFTSSLKMYLEPMKGKQICPFFIKSDPVLRLSDLELFTPCWAETKGKRLSYNLNTMNLQWNKAAWASTIPKCALTFNSKSVWQWMAWKLLPTWWPMFSQISVCLFGFWVGLAIIHGAGAGAQMQTEAQIKKGTCPRPPR